LISKYFSQNQKIKAKLNSKFKSVNIIFYGAPGTGKSYKVDKIIENLDLHYYERITFHPEYDNASFIGGYKPISEKDSSGSDTIKYKFVPQAFTNIYERAWQDLDNQYYLVIEEINRGNCAEIFGEIFQLLDRTSKYTVSPTKELKEYLINEAFKDENHLGIVNGLKLPPNLSILATMNTSDQSLFPMDSAFKRRWDWEYIPICYNPIDDFKKKNDSFDFEIDIEDGKKYSWIKFIEKVNLNHIKNNPSLGMDKCIGNYFIKPDKDNIISLRPFVNKVIFYLWNDVFKDEDNKVFEDNTSYEDFFPIDTNGKKKIKELFDRIDLKAIPSLEIVEDENPLGQVAESPEEMES
jgi:5-methylcytosine-specific restriction endonuclease McrBC GTP-binding regulatory subunit McrB